MNKKIGIEAQRIAPEYAIGLYRLYDDNGKLTAIPHPCVGNPILTGASITDNRAEFEIESSTGPGQRFVADPFVVHEGNRYYMFFEAMIGNRGSIALATSADGLNWRYEKVVLSEKFHLSYPCIFKWGNTYYMIPESGEDLSIRLYKASHFPHRWEFVKKILEDNNFADSTVLYFSGYWWLFTCTNENQTLWLYYCSMPDGQWIMHPKSPIVKKDVGKARPGGPFLNWKGRLLRITQSARPHYGYCVRAFEIVRMDPQDYEERELQREPILIASGKGWNADGMHQLSVYTGVNNEILAAVDGKKNNYQYNLFMRLPRWNRTNGY
jgi:hypothetical protein